MKTMREKAEVVEMAPNFDKIVEAILHVVNAAKDRHRYLTQYDIVKTIFLADRAHLNKYGRPITYDNYVAMKDGPVPSTTYNFLKQHDRVLTKYAKDLPWQREQLDPKKFNFFAPSREADEDVLSPSDMAELESNLTVVKALGFTQIRKLTHEDPAYIDAWEDTGGPNRRYPMSYGMLMESKDFEKAKDLAFISKHL